MSYDGIVQNGVVVFDNGRRPPDGVRVVVVTPPGGSVAGEISRNEPESETPDGESKRFGACGELLAATTWPAEDFRDWESPRE